MHFYFLNSHRGSVGRKRSGTARENPKISKRFVRTPCCWPFWVRLLFIGCHSVSPSFCSLHYSFCPLTHARLSFSLPLGRVWEERFSVRQEVERRRAQKLSHLASRWHFPRCHTKPDTSDNNSRSSENGEHINTTMRKQAQLHCDGPGGQRRAEAFLFWYCFSHDLCTAISIKMTLPDGQPVAVPGGEKVSRKCIHTGALSKMVPWLNPCPAVEELKRLRFILPLPNDPFPTQKNKPVGGAHKSIHFPFNLQPPAFDDLDIFQVVPEAYEKRNQQLQPLAQLRADIFSTDGRNNSSRGE